jgi:hypothetical protein
MSFLAELLDEPRGNFHVTGEIMKEAILDEQSR